MQAQNIVAGLPKFKVAEMHKVCEASQFGKQARKPFLRHVQESEKPLELIHSDVWTTKATSIAGYHYFVTFIDDYNRKVWVYFMKKKSEVFGHFKAFKAMVEKEIGLQIKCLRSDGGGEYLSNEFARFLQEHGIKQQYSCSQDTRAITRVFIRLPANIHAFLTDYPRM